MPHDQWFLPRWLNSTMGCDYLIVGAGLFGSVFAHEATKRGSSVVVVEKKEHVGGNCFTQKTEGIHVHKYGPHCFHTANKNLWDYINQFSDFNNFELRTKALYEGMLYSMPINLMTMHQVWGVSTPKEAQAKLESVRLHIENPRNLEDHMLSQVGPELYEMFVKGYTTKQWGRSPSKLPASIIKRLPVRMYFNDRWFPDKDRWEGIPVDGYTAIFERMLEGIEVRLGVDFLADREYWKTAAKKIVYTGPLDDLFEQRFGPLEYRSLRFEQEIVQGDYQGNAIINHTGMEVPWTRVIEHKHFYFDQDNPLSVITKEYPEAYDGRNTPYYPINDEKNNARATQYHALGEQDNRLIIGGRLGRYQYYNMDQTIANALATIKREFQE